MAFSIVFSASFADSPVLTKQMPAQSNSCSTLSFTFSLQQLNDKLPKNNDQKNKLSVKENGPTLQVFIYIAKKNIKFTFQLLKQQTELFYCLFVLYVFFSWYLLLRCGFNRKPDGPLGICLHKNVIWSVLFGWCLVWWFFLFCFFLGQSKIAVGE